MSKVLVFCMDALCACDVEEMRTMPHFGPYLEKAAVVKHINPVWPALTYCCHTSIITGCYVDRHGVENNEKLKRGGFWNQPWYGKKADVKVPTLLDRAREHGMTTCSISWPVSGGADYDMNMPMIVPYHYQGWDPDPYLEGMATKNLMDRYFYKHGRYIKGADRSLDLLTMAFGIFLIVLSVYYLKFSKSITLRPTLTTTILCAAVSGVCGGLFGIGGPLLALYYLATSKGKQAYIANIQTTFFITNTVNTITRICNGIYTLDLFPLTLLGLAGISVGNFFGLRILDRINIDRMRTAIYIFIGISGVLNVLEYVFP